MSNDKDTSDRLLVDYTETIAAWRWYADVRFKLLSLLPLLTAVGVGLFAEGLGFPSLFVATLGSLATLGIASYDLRNTMMHDAAIHRAKYLEEKLELPVTSVLAGDLGDRGGLLRERPRMHLSLPFRWGRVDVYHDAALRLVYAASFAAWVGLAARSLSAALDRSEVDGLLLSVLPTDVIETSATTASSLQWLISIIVALLSFFVASRSMRAYENSWDCLKHAMARQHYESLNVKDIWARVDQHKSSCTDQSRVEKAFGDSKKRITGERLHGHALGAERSGEEN